MFLDELPQLAGSVDGPVAWLPKAVSLPLLRRVIEKLASKRPPMALRLPPKLYGLVWQVELLRDVVTLNRSEESALVAHMLAQVARAALAEEVEDGSAVSLCADVLDMDRTTLCQYAPLARWSHEDITDLLSLRGEHGEERVSISHLQLLARAPRSAAREVIDRMHTETITVRELRSLLGR